MIKRVLFALASLAVVSAGEYNSTVQGCILGTLSGCSTSPVKGLSDQIMRELNNMGYRFVNMNTQWIRCSGGCNNVLQDVAHNALVRAAQSKNDYITLNSAWRSSAEQYVLYRWQGGCGIQIAAKPGQSNHESGLAIDVAYYDYWRTALQNNGWRWYGSGDLVHYDYVAGGTDLRSANLKAFQRLWNRHTGSHIAEDGIYGPETANALYNAPCGGW